MESPELINIIGLASSFVGTCIVGYSASKYFVMVHIHIAMLELTISEYLGGNQFIPAFQGTEDSRKKYLSRSTYWLNLGVVLILLGFLLQVIASPTVFAYLTHLTARIKI
jgi:hypothetical protein